MDLKGRFGQVVFTSQGKMDLKEANGANLGFAHILPPRILFFRKGLKRNKKEKTGLLAGLVWLAWLPANFCGGGGGGPGGGAKADRPPHRATLHPHRN